MIFNFLVMFFLKKTASSFSLAVFFKQDLYVFYDGIHKMILTDKILEGTVIVFIIILRQWKTAIGSLLNELMTVIAYPIEFLVLIVIGWFVDLSHDVALSTVGLGVIDFEMADHFAK